MDQIETAIIGPIDNIILSVYSAMIYRRNYIRLNRLTEDTFSLQTTFEITSCTISTEEIIYFSKFVPEC